MGRRSLARPLMASHSHHPHHRQHRRPLAAIPRLLLPPNDQNLTRAPDNRRPVAFVITSAISISKQRVDERRDRDDRALPVKRHTRKHHQD
jgi:hypothetical protein